jgi:hypothetical protein
VKQILGLGTGTATFTPGAAGEGTIVIAGMIGFSPARLLVVSNVTQNAIIYAAEKEPHGTDPGKGGAWSSLTSAGGTLTLAADTSDCESNDILRCIYDTDEVPALVRPRGGNLWPVDLDACELASGNTRTADYGPGPRPGTRSTRLVLAGDNVGANTGALTLAGRTDGAMFGLAIDIKGSGTLELRLRAVGSSSGVTETVASLAITATATWKRYVVRGYVAQFDCSTIQAEIRATGSGATIDASAPDLRLLDNLTEFPEYQPPNGAAQTVYIHRRLTTTVAAWSDSMWDLCSVPLAALLKGTKVYNGGVGGETTDQVRDRFLATTDAAKLYRAYGVTVIWCGHNNYTDIDNGTLISEIEEMIAALKHSRFLIIPLVGGSGAAPGTGPYPYYCRAYKGIKQRYGTRFCDAAMPLHAGTAYSIDAFRRDTQHLNAVGWDIVAHEVAKSIKRNGWLEDVAGVFDFGESADQEQTHHITLQTSVAAAAADTELLPIGKRHGFSVVNDSASASMYLALGGYASGSSFTRKLAPGECYELYGGKFHGPVHAQWTAAVGNARVTEII